MPFDVISFDTGTNEVADALDRAADLIAAPERWTQGMRRRHDPLTDITSFCAAGALGHVCQSHELYVDCMRAVNWIALRRDEQVLTVFNDNHLHAEVVAVVREAAAAARLRCP